MSRAKKSASKKDELQAGIQHLIANSDAFAFLKDEEDLYTIDDIVKYDPKLANMIKEAEKGPFYTSAQVKQAIEKWKSKYPR